MQEASSYMNEAVSFAIESDISDGGEKLRARRFYVDLRPPTQLPRVIVAQI